MTSTASSQDQSDLLSSATLFRIAVAIGMLAALMAVISIAGTRIGDRLADGGHTTSQDIRHIIIGQDVLALHENIIRFQQQRRSGPADKVNVYLSWPAMRGYSRDNASIFSDPARSASLIFAEFAQSVMTRDMTGRLDPIYRRLFRGKPRPGPAGLEIHTLDAAHGFGPEVLVTGRRRSGEMFVARCILPGSGETSTSADCQRDVHVGHDLTMIYRFSAKRLGDWSALDTAMHDFALRALDPGEDQGKRETKTRIAP